ncbi:TPA: hypothetical protein ACNRPQ_004708 [Raoultella ornithinolytica]
MKINPESILAILRKDARNNITAFHRWQTAQGALGHMTGITLNYHEPYYEGWAPALEMREVSISAPELQQVIPFLSVEHWGDGLIGGEIYRIPRGEE